MKVVKSVIKDMVLDVKDFILNNLYTMSKVLTFLIPYLAIILCRVTELNIWVIIGLILFIQMVLIISRNSANKIGKGIDVPVPYKRFTQVDEDGEVSVDTERLQEMILYMGDLEDYFERKGLS